MFQLAQLSVSCRRWWKGRSFKRGRRSARRGIRKRYLRKNGNLSKTYGIIVEANLHLRSSGRNAKEECRKLIPSQISSFRTNSMKYSQSGNNNFTFSDFKADQKFMFSLFADAGQADNRAVRRIDRKIDRKGKRDRADASDRSAYSYSLHRNICYEVTNSPTARPRICATVALALRSRDRKTILDSRR